MMIYMENPKELKKELLELISDYSNVAEYKVNLQKPIALLYTSNA